MKNKVTLGPAGYHTTFVVGAFYERVGGGPPVSEHLGDVYSAIELYGEKWLVNLTTGVSRVRADEMGNDFRRITETITITPG